MYEGIENTDLVDQQFCLNGYFGIVSRTLRKYAKLSHGHFLYCEYLVPHKITSNQSQLI